MSIKKIKIYMGICSLGTRSDTQCYSLREMEKVYKDKVELVYPRDPIYRIFHDCARNAVVEEFLESGCDVLWFLDSDIVPPYNVLDLVVDHFDKWQAAGACYPIFMRVPGAESREPSVQFTAYKGVKENADGSCKGITLSAVPKSGKGIEWVDGLATGCLFIKRSVFELLSKPYFEFKFNAETRGLTEGEDLGFCLKLNKLGIQFLTDFSMICQHYKQVNLLDVNNYAMNMSNDKIIEFDKTIRSQVDGALAASYQRGRQDGIKESLEKKAKPQGLILPSYY